MIRLEIPYPVSANRYWTDYVLPNTKRSVRGPTKEAKQYKREVQGIARLAGLRAPLQGRLRVFVGIIPHRPLDAAKRAARDPNDWDLSVQCIDTDNASKVLGDALQGVIYENDSQVHKWEIERLEPGVQGAIVIVEPWVPAWLRQENLFEQEAAQ